MRFLRHHHKRRIYIHNIVIAETCVKTTVLLYICLGWEWDKKGFSLCLRIKNCKWCGIATHAASGHGFFCKCFRIKISKRKKNEFPKIRPRLSRIHNFENNKQNLFSHLELVISENSLFFPCYLLKYHRRSGPIFFSVAH